MVSYRTLCCMPCSDVHFSLMQVSELIVKKRAVQIRTSRRQTVAQHYFTIGPMYRVTWAVAFRGNKVSPAWQSEQTRDNHTIMFQCRVSVEDCGSLLKYL